MKKYCTLLLVIAFSFSAAGQKLDKIKGNKEVVDVYNTLENFNTLEIGNGLEITIKQGETDKYHLETDSNLVDQIAFEEEDGVLRIYTKSKIQSSKKLNIELTSVSLDMITLKEGTNLIGMSKIEADELQVVVLDNSEFKLDLSVNKLAIIMKGNCKGDLALKGGELDVKLSDNATLKGDMTIVNCTVEVNERSDFEMDGDVNEVSFTTTETANVKASKLRADMAVVNAADDSDIYINATKKLSIYAQGKSNIYVYGNPEIIIDGFKDTSQIVKK